MSFLCAEYDYEMDIKVQREESYEEGFEQGKLNAYLEMFDENNINRELFKDKTGYTVEQSRKLIQQGK